MIDRVTRAGWDSPLLQNWSLVTQAAATAGLLFVGLARRSRSLLVVTFLMGLIFVEEAFHVLTWFNGIERRVGRRIATVTPLSADVAGWVVLYAGIAAVGLAFLAYAYWSAVVAERRVVRNFTLLLAVGGLFGGVVSATAALVDPARLTFVEELESLSPMPSSPAMSRDWSMWLLPRGSEEIRCGLPGICQSEPFGECHRGVMRRA